ncbi:MAG: hypothetical protein HKN32_08280 [Flavobacteriales bacterium]|nr:hypothetical protein [Flavobacteriales bacterium]
MAFFKEGEMVKLGHIQAQNDWLVEQFEGKPYYVLLQGGFGATFEPEVREWARSPERAKYVAADAFVVKTLAHKLMINFYLTYHKPNHPTKVFSSVDKARNWLLKKMEEAS